jgi:ribosomal protein S18 acetylase RimI-like enzyme
VTTRTPTWDDQRAVEALLQSGPLDEQWRRPGFDLSRDALVLATRERIRAYGTIDAGGSLAVAAAGDDDADMLLAGLVTLARERGERSVFLRTHEVDGLLDRLVRSHPFAFDKETLTMWRPLTQAVPEPELPDGVVIGTFDRSDARDVHELLDIAYLGWDRRYVTLTHEEWLASMTGDPEYDPSVWWVARRDYSIVGCALHWDSGWLKDLAVRESEREYGIGTALVTQGLTEFSRRGLSRVGLKVDAANPSGALHLYERLGFRVEARETVWIWNL